MFHLTFFILAILVLGCDSEEAVTTRSSETVNQKNNGLVQISTSTPISNNISKKQPQRVKPQNNTKLSGISQKKPGRDDLYKANQTFTFYEDFDDFEDFDPEDEHDKEQVNYLGQLKNSTDARLRVKAIEALDDVEAGRLLQSLRVAALDDTEQSVRIAALKKLAGIDLYEAVDTILYALDDHDSDVVMAAINAVEETADESLIPKLMPLLEHSDNEVRQRAEEVIEFMN